MPDFDHDKVTPFEFDHIPLAFLGGHESLRHLAGIAHTFQKFATYSGEAWWRMACAVDHRSDYEYLGSGSFSRLEMNLFLDFCVFRNATHVQRKCAIQVHLLEFPAR